MIGIMKSICLLLVGVVAPAWAGPVDDVRTCIDIKDGKKRLACFDGAASRLPDAKAAEEAEATRKAVAAKEQGDAIAREALVALKKLGVRVSTGVSYRDYSGVLAEAKFPVQSYLDSTAAKSRPDVAKAMLEAMNHYEIANRLWQYKFGGSHGLNRWIFKDMSLYSVMMAQYPEARPDTTGALVIDELLPIAWRHAREHVNEAERLFSGGPAPASASGFNW